MLQLLLARAWLRPAPARASLSRVSSRSGLFERQARPGPGRGGGRPDRRQHRSRSPPAPAVRWAARSPRVGLLRDQLIQLRMLVEATLDFPEEEIDFLQKADAFGRRTLSPRSCRPRPARVRVRFIAREGPQRWCWPASPMSARVPCSTRLGGAELAIVTPIPGTTRDQLSQPTDRGRAAAHRRHRRPARGHRRRGRAHRHRAQLERHRGRRRRALLHDLGRMDRPRLLPRHARIRTRLQKFVDPHRILQVKFTKADLASPPAGEGL